MVISDRTIANWSPSRILDDIVKHPQKYPKDYAYIILGKGGPTGKSWLNRELISRGYKSFDLSETLYETVDYGADTTRCGVNHVQKYVVIILNRWIKRDSMTCKEG